MPDKIPDANVDLSLTEFQSLDPQVLQDLQKQHGLEVQVRSNSAAVNAILTSLGRSIGKAAEFTRGFDRTSPGYDKYYNRDFVQARPGDAVINPATMTLQDALKTLSPQQLIDLKREIK